MDTYGIIFSAIGGDGDIIENALPLWQKMIPYACLAYTIIALWAGAFMRMWPYREGKARMGWSVFIILLPFIGSLYTIYSFRVSKYKNTPTVNEQAEAEKKAAKIAAQEQEKRDQEARESFNPFG